MAKPGWQRRNELARQRGYKSYYDYRAHGYGRTPADQPRARGEVLRRLRGHSSRADLLRAIRSGRVEILSQTAVESSRDPKTGQIRVVEVQAWFTDETTRVYRLHGKQIEGPALEELREAVREAGTDLYVSPSPDVLGLALAA